MPPALARGLQLRRPRRVIRNGMRVCPGSWEAAWGEGYKERSLQGRPGQSRRLPGNKRREAHCYPLALARGPRWPFSGRVGSLAASAVSRCGPSEPVLIGRQESMGIELGAQGGEGLSGGDSPEEAGLRRRQAAKQRQVSHPAAGQGQQQGLGENKQRCGGRHTGIRAHLRMAWAKPFALVRGLQPRRLCTRRQRTILSHPPGRAPLLPELRAGSAPCQRAAQPFRHEEEPQQTGGGLTVNP